MGVHGSRLFRGLLASVVLAACGGSSPSGSSTVDGSATSKVCVPGQQVACACAGGGAGAQVCSSDGQSYGSCTGCSARASSSGGGDATSASDGSANGPDDATVGDGGGAGDATLADTTSGGGDGDATLADTNTGGGAGDATIDALSGETGTSSGGEPPDGAASLDAATAACADGGLACYVRAGCTTSLSGHVYDPAGLNPLYDAVVFVPNDPLGAIPAITPGTSSCSACGAPIGDYVAATTTDATGHFTLTGVPATTHVPFVVQIGKWRREVFLPSVMACEDNAVPAASSRLPRNQGEGDLPQMAVVTGGCDDMACFLTGVGIDTAEFTAPQGGGRVDVYQGLGLVGNGASLSNGTAGNCTTSPSTSCVWNSQSNFEYYDIAMLSCECGENTQTKPASSMTALRNWLDEGGKVLASHFHYTWFKDNPSTDFQNVATWLGSSIADGEGTYDINNINVIGSFPKGVIFGQWLGDAGALAATGMPDTMALTNVASSVSTVNPTTTQEWIYDPSSTGDAGAHDVKYLSFGTPVGGLADAGPTGDGGGASHCGKAVFTDLHAGGSLVAQYSSVPADCPTNATLTAQQKALEFLFFDLSSCVSDDTMAPPPPPPSSP